MGGPWFFSVAIFAGALAAAVPGRLPRRLGPHEVVVVDEFVAVVNEQIGSRLLHSDADDRLVVLAQLAHERREIRVAADDRESVDVTFRVTKIERVDHHADVGGILARLPDVRNLDHLESGFVQSALEGFVALKIAIRLFHHDVSLEQKTLEDFADVEGRELRVVRAEGDIFQIEEDGHRGLGILGAHDLEDVREIAVAKQEKVHRIRKTAISP